MTDGPAAEERPGTLRQRLSGITAVHVCALLAVAAPTALVLFDYSAAQAGLVLAAIVVAAVFLRWEDVTSFSLFGVSARLREAERAVARANTTADALRKLALPLARTALAIASGGGRLGTSDLVTEQTVEQVERLLTLVKAKPAERFDAFTEIRAWRRVDLGSDVLQAVCNAIRAAGGEIPRDLGHDLVGRAGLEVARAAEWRDLAQAHETLTPEVQSAIAALDEAEKAEADGAAGMSSKRRVVRR